MRKALVHKIGSKCGRQVRRETDIESDITCPACLHILHKLTWESHAVSIARSKFQQDVNTAICATPATDGIMSRLMNDANVTSFNPSELKLEDFATVMDNLRKQDDARRAILDKEYTPIEDIKLKDLEFTLSQYGDDIPKGLFLKVRWGGRYLDLPAKTFLDLLRRLEKRIATIKLSSQNK